MKESIRRWCGRLSYRCGVWVLLMCVPLYVASFAQMLLPVGAGMKGVLWVVLFGMAKTCQYGGLAIIGAEGVRRLRSRMRQLRLTRRRRCAGIGAKDVDKRCKRL